ncbi:hypothetical protein N798_00830 [Knoellia flava TL1]|uniref:Superfamily III holin-X n=2 Tax=Knoellia flava TaxID=913969 RepID=A0A8H9FVT1_9MICO|nr:phage holin family protein [Knoellia flava]KGN35819.1 hypothetical protein N798_00830 [Knoellia flava TL1]GGB80465.1 hypothetical protein GCM10011314_20110 [Knoellia flava]
MSHAANRPSSDEELPLRSIGALVSDISSDLSTLVRQEVELAKAEAKQSATQAGKGAGMLGAAAVAAQLALVFLSVAAWWALGEVIGRGWSGLVVALVWAVIAAILAATGRSQLKKSPMGLPRTTETVKDIPEALKGHQTP